MDKTAPDFEEAKYGNIDEYWKVIETDVTKIIEKHLGLTLNEKEGWEMLWDFLFLHGTTPLSRNDEKCLRKIYGALQTVQANYSKLGEEARDQLAMHAAAQTDFDARAAEVNKMGYARTAHDSALQLKTIFDELQNPINITEALIKSEVPSGKRVRNIGWKGAYAMEGVREYWRVRTGSTVNSWNEGGAFAKFAHDVWVYFELEGTPRSALEAMQGQILQSKQ